MTGRLPFDPGRMKPSRGETPGGKSSENDRPLTVTELAARVDSAIKTGLPARVRVLGEISGLRERTHLYLTIKDAGAAISAVVFASTARRMSTPPRDGLQVVATGRVEFYAPSGKLSLIIDSLEPVGKGPLEEQFRRLASELRELGWFDPEHKKALPAFPDRIAVVTSKSGAALQDVIDTARRRCPAVGLLVVDARVQGPSAKGEIARAIRSLGQAGDRLGIQGILLTRGGGSLEDLWAFNEREVAQAIWECPIPVIAAIGHETDTTIAELVADERGATPTQAAMRLTPDRKAILEQVSALHRRLEDSTNGRLRFARERLRRFAERPVFRSPAELTRPSRERVDRLERFARGSMGSGILSRRSRLDQLGVRLERARPSNLHARREERLLSLSSRLGRVARRAIEKDRLGRLDRALRSSVRTRVLNSGVDLESVWRELEAISPTRVLERGYSVTVGPDGMAITEPGSVKTGDLVRTRVFTGSFESRVTGEQSTTPNPVHAKPLPVRRSKRTTPDSRDQLDLFGSGG